MSTTPSIPKPHGTALAALKGLAIASSLLTAGQLITLSTFLPSLYETAETSHRLAAQQFARQYRTLRATNPPVGLLTTLICTGLAYLGFREDRQATSWKLWAGAAGAIFSVIPWTLVCMEGPSGKLLWVSEVAETATTTRVESTGIGVKVTSPSPERAAQFDGARGKGIAGGMLGVPAKGNGARGGAITPMEEFEPFEDAPMDEREYVQLKVVTLLKQYNSLNVVRTLAPLAAGVLGLCAWASEGS